MAEDNDDNSTPNALSFISEGPLVVPAKTTYISTKGDTALAIGAADQLRHDEDGRWYEKRFFVIPAQRIPFGPLIQDGLVSVPPFSDEDWSHLEKVLGPIIPEQFRERIDAACQLLVNSIVLKGRMAKWTDLLEILEEVTPTAKELLATLISVKPSALENGALSARQTIGTYIAVELNDPPYGLDRIIADLTRLVAFGEATIPVAKAGPGVEGQAELRIFLHTLFEVSVGLGVPIKLIGNDQQKGDPDEDPPPKRPPPKFFRFAHEALRLANIYGALGISKSALDQGEKDAATEILNKYASKKENTLSKQLARINERIKTGSLFSQAL